MPTTEDASPRFRDSDLWPTPDLIEAIVEGQLAAVAAVHAAAPRIAEAADAAVARLERGGRLIYVGAGTSGRIGAQDAAELFPTFNWPLDRVAILMAGGTNAFLRAIERSEDDEEAARAELGALAPGEDDVVIGLAASGRTPYTLAALAAAREAGALAIGICNNRQSAMAERVDIAILVETGAEIIAGSTRMKAGTAQKAALNTLSTGIMIRLGYVFGGRMVNMRATNAKLDQRAIRMVADLSDRPEEVARDALAAADGDIRLAVVIATTEVDAKTAEERLKATNGDLRAALGDAAR